MGKDRKTHHQGNEVGADMSYNKHTESMLSFILPTILKDDLVEYCATIDRNQSQVLREAVTQYVRFMKYQHMENQAGKY